MITTTPTRTTLAALVLAAALPLSLASCSTADSAPTASEAAAGMGAVWGECMRNAGLDVQDPPDDVLESGAIMRPEGIDLQSWGQAESRCSAQAGVEQTDTAEKQKLARQYDQVASCIRDHGYDDFPEQDKGSISVDPETYPRAAEPQFDETFAECLAEYAPDTKTQDMG